MRGLLSTVWLPDPDGDDPNTTGPKFCSWTKYYHDDQGRVIRVENTLQRLTDYVYNNRDWVTQTTLPDPDGTGPLSNPVISTTYDSAGLRAVANRSLGQCHRADL